MTRILGIVLTVVFGAAAIPSPTPTTARGQRVADTCHDALVERTGLVGLAALAAVVGGSAVAFGAGVRRPGAPRTLVLTRVARR